MSDFIPELTPVLTRAAPLTSHMETDLRGGVECSAIVKRGVAICRLRLGYVENISHARHAILDM